MKKFIFNLLITLCPLLCFAQNSESQMNDEERIAIAVELEKNYLNEDVGDVLESKLTQIITNNGLGYDDTNAIFYMTPKISLIRYDITSTQPAYHVYLLEISISIKDKLKGNIYASITRKFKGVGKSKTEAFTKAVRMINPRKSYYKAFVRKAKKNILKFYNTDIEFILSTATAHINKGENEEAKKLLLSVPKVCRESYDRSMELYKTIEQ